MERWAVGGASVTLTVADRRALIEWTGPITDRLLKTLVPGLVAALDRSPVDALLAKLTHATLAVTPLELVEFFKPAPAALARPGALVVDEATIPMARETCGRLAELGVIRAAFTDPSAALQWAREMVQLAQAERAWEDRQLRRYVLGNLQSLPASSARKPQGSQRRLSASRR